LPYERTGQTAFEGDRGLLDPPGGELFGVCELRDGPRKRAPLDGSPHRKPAGGRGTAGAGHRHRAGLFCHRPREARLCRHRRGLHPGHAGRGQGKRRRIPGRYRFLPHGCP